MEQLSAFAKSGAHPPDRALPGSPRQCSLPLACSQLPKFIKLELGKGGHFWTTSPTNHTAAVSQPIGSVAKTAGSISRGSARPYTRRKDPPTLSYPVTRFRRERVRVLYTEANIARCLLDRKKRATWERLAALPPRLPHGGNKIK